MQKDSPMSLRPFWRLLALQFRFLVLVLLQHPVITLYAMHPFVFVQVVYNYDIHIVHTTMFHCMLHVNYKHTITVVVL
jgi:hypothetical protein